MLVSDEDEIENEESESDEAKEESGELLYSWEDHMEQLDRVMSVLRANHLYVNRKKCLFAQEQLEYLGHVVSRTRVATNFSKIQAMLDWPSPWTIKELQGFLGLTGYYRRFVAGYGRIAWSLTQQLKKDAFAWNSEAEEVFQCLKKAITEIPVLALPDFS
ncbi:uncharacterized protein LOC112091557 [Morus notabilis]|uniref:uncharacterized protein LOC112091557 n=1 Tax=Morus notabilis TaxID=981085 RepID=UPI000CED415A|nr:uncharacterized protein LOC112091557 [Morus notabilis]